MMYFTETGEYPEDPIALNDAFEAEYDTTTYEKNISRLMARAYRRIKRDNPKKLRLWNDAFAVVGKGDHYLLLFWRPNALRRSPRMWRTYVLAALAVVCFCLLTFLFFGNRERMSRGQQAPIDKYIPRLSPLVQHTLQFLFLLAFLLARTVPTESVADILERELDPVIHDWLALVEKPEHLMSITLSYEDRTGHFPALLREVIARLEVFKATHDLPSVLFCTASIVPEPETVPLLFCSTPLS